MTPGASAFEAAAGQGRDWIAARIPHQGRMCLLDRVVRADASGVLCTTESHRAADHPLREQGRLGAACGIEYAAQAMALHGAMMADTRGAARPARGMLVSVRGVALHVARLDDVAGELSVQVQMEADNGDHSVYAFCLQDGERVLVQGRAIVRLDAAPAPAASPELQKQ